jgi:threonine dehydrogenase-like Zn-dependent dehydrogenase
MKVLQYLAPRRAAIIEVETPRPKKDMVLTKSLFCSVSAGTEMGFYRGTAPQFNSSGDKYGIFADKKDNIKFPMKSDDPGVWWMGYANVSKVVEVGPDVKNLNKGDIVFTGAGHQDHQCRTEGSLQKLPNDINLEHAALLSLMQIAFNGILDAGIRLMDTVVIFGMGTLGQLQVQMAKKDGATVIAVDGCDNRLELAKKGGADHVIDFRKEKNVAARVYELTEGRGADIVIEVSGNVNALPDAIKCAAYNGKVTVLSFYQGGAASLELGKEFHHKRIAVQSSQIGGIDPEISNAWNGGRRMATSIKLLRELNIEPIISHKISYDELPKMLEVIDNDPSACNAVIVKY